LQLPSHLASRPFLSSSLLAQASHLFFSIGHVAVTAHKNTHYIVCEFRGPDHFCLHRSTCSVHRSKHTQHYIITASHHVLCSSTGTLPSLTTPLSPIRLQFRDLCSCLSRNPSAVQRFFGHFGYASQPFSNRISLNSYDAH
jgi:hypothetical protein